MGDKALHAVLASKFYARHCVITPSEKHEDGTVTLGEGTVLVRGPRLSVVLVTEQLCDDYTPWLLAALYGMGTEEFSTHSHAALGAEVESSYGTKRLRPF